MLISFYNIYKKNGAGNGHDYISGCGKREHKKNPKNSVLKKIGAGWSVKQGIKLVWPNIENKWKRGKLFKNVIDKQANLNSQIAILNTLEKQYFQN